MISGKTASAWACTSCSVSVPNGCGTTIKARSGAPCEEAFVRESVVKLVEMMVQAGLPSFSRVTASWTLHDEQEPQSPNPVIMASHA